MRLRKLRMEDAPGMLEWMHDPGCVENLQADFSSKTMEDCRRFIASTWENQKDLHLAIADEQDVYMGTVSLKHIDREKANAEFAISMRACAMGKGYSRDGMRAILDMGLGEMGLEEIYWCVSPDNKRAVRFYDKNGYHRMDGTNLKMEGYTPEQIRYYIWYMERNE